MSKATATITAKRRRRGQLWQRGWPDHTALTSKVTVTVPFQDADPTGVAWHGNYFRYFDTARIALLAKLDFGYRDMAQIGQIWPIIDTRVRYIRSAAFGSELQVSAQLVEWEFRLRLYYQILQQTGERITEAYTVQVPVAADTEALMVGVPEFLQRRIQQLIDSAPQ